MNEDPQAGTVLVFDDYPVQREGIVAALSASAPRRRVGVVADRRDAAQAVHRATPSAVVVGLDPGAPDWLGIVRHLRREFPALPILALVLGGAREQLAATRAAGADGCLPTGATRAELVGALQAVEEGRPVEPAGDGARASLRAPGGELTVREREVLRLTARGLTDAEIAAELGLSAYTVQNYLRHVRHKTGLHRRSELTRWSVEQGLS